MIIEYNMITIMIMIVKAVIKKKNIPVQGCWRSYFPPHTDHPQKITGKWLLIALEVIFSDCESLS